MHSLVYKHLEKKYGIYLLQWPNPKASYQFSSTWLNEIVKIISFWTIVHIIILYVDVLHF